MVFNTTITNISAILWRSAFLVEKSEAIEENHPPVATSGIPIHNFCGDRH